MKKENLQSFNAMLFDFNRKDIINIDVMPYLRDCYDKAKKKPETFEEFKSFVNSESMYRYWARCEYEIIVSDWPNSSFQKKIDVYSQIKSNIDIVTKILMEYAELKAKRRAKRIKATLDNVIKQQKK